MAWSVVQSVTGGSADSHNVPATTGVDTTSANLLLMFLSEYQAATAAAVPADSKSNTWVALTLSEIAGGARGRWYYVNSGTPSVGTGHTFSTASGNVAYPSICVLALSGSIGAAPLGNQNGAAASGAVTTLQPGSVSPNASGDIAVVGLTFGASTTPSIDSSFTLGVTTDYVGVSHYGSAIAYKTVTAAENPTWTFTLMSDIVTRIVTFKAAAALVAQNRRILGQAVNRAGTY